MSWRISLDHHRAGADFVVPSDGSFEDALERYGWQRPLKIYFKDPAVAVQWLDAWQRAEEWYDWNGISGIFHVDASGMAHDADLTEPYTYAGLRKELVKMTPCNAATS